MASVANYYIVLIFHKFCIPLYLNFSIYGILIMFFDVILNFYSVYIVLYIMHYILTYQSANTFPILCDSPQSSVLSDKLKRPFKKRHSSLPHTPSNRVNKYLAQAIEARSVHREQADHVSLVTLCFKDRSKERQVSRRLLKVY